MMMTESGGNLVPLLSFPKSLIWNPEEQIDLVTQATVERYGDLQGIAGKFLQAIEARELKALGVSQD